jgi:glutamate transport system permease protein
VEWFTENREDILRSFAFTVEMVVAAGVIALVVGSVMAAFRVSPVPLARGIGTLYVYTVRNTPLLAIMILFAFGLPNLGIHPDVSLGSADVLHFNNFFVFATAALGLYTAAFVCEALRSGINTVPVGQAEAARALGLSFSQVLRHVVLPQAFRSSVVPLANVLIALIKNTTVAAAIGVAETALLMKEMIENEAQLLLISAVIALVFVVLTLPTGLILGWVGKKVAVKR